MEALGLDLKWFLFQLGDFLILLVGLTYLLHKPMMKLLETRKQEIAEGLEHAQAAKQALAGAEERQKELLDQTRKESAAILQETKERAEKLEMDLNSKAKKQAEELRQKAQSELAQEHEQLRSELKAELADMVVAATEKILNEEAPAEKQKQIKKQVSQLKS